MFRKELIHGCESRGDYDSAYMTRYVLFECKFGKICLHIFHRSDADVMHDHPWNFLSIILWRGYYEETECEYSKYPIKLRKYPLSFLWRKATHRHRVVLINEKPAVTLVIMGKRLRRWGFWTKEGWIDFRKYFLKNGC